MSKINLKGVTSEMLANMLILFIAVINAIFQMFGIHLLPIANDDITNIVSTVFLIVTTLWNTWKNRNFTSASQIAQNITNAIKDGELLEEDVKNLMIKLTGKG